MHELGMIMTCTIRDLKLLISFELLLGVVLNLSFVDIFETLLDPRFAMLTMAAKVAVQ